MAVTKIRRLSKFTLLALIVISVIICLIFFLGGNTIDSKGNTVYTYTSLLLWWTYILSGLTILAGILFAIFGFISSFRHNPKKAMSSLLGVILLIVVLGISYTLGDSSKLTTLSADNQAYNTPEWLKTTDMWLFTIYIMFILVVIAVVWGAIRKIFLK